MSVAAPVARPPMADWTVPRRRTARLFGRAIVLLGPAAILAVGGVAMAPAPMLWLGAGLLLFTALILIPQPKLAAASTGLAVIAIYVLAQVWLWYCAGRRRLLSGEN